MVLDDAVCHPRVALREGRSRSTPTPRAREVVRPPVQVLPPTPGTDHDREPEEVDGREAHRRVHGIGPLALQPTRVPRPRGEGERVVRRGGQRRGDAPRPQPIRGRVAPGHDEIGRARDLADEGRIPRRQATGIDRVRETRLPHGVGAVRSPKEVPEEHGGPRVHVRAPLDEDEDVGLVDQLPDRSEEDRREGDDLEVRPFSDVAGRTARLNTCRPLTSCAPPT